MKKIKNTTDFWKYFAYTYFAINTICVIILMEVLFVGKPFVSLFLIIFGFTYYSNRRKFKRKLAEEPGR